MKYRFLLLVIFISCFLVSAYSQQVEKGPYRFFGGVSIPVNEFKAAGGSDAGYAKLGYTFSVEYAVPLDLPINFGVDILSSATLSANSFNDQPYLYNVGVGYLKSPYTALQQTGRAILASEVDESGSYYSGFLMTGPAVRYLVVPAVRLHGAVQAGLFVGTYPALESLNNGGIVFSQDRSTAAAFAYALSGGVEINNNFIVGVRYFYAAPKYNIARTVNLIPSSYDYKLPTSFIMVVVGFGI